MAINPIFFGLKALSQWPESFPHGRLIQDRHATLAFLGRVDKEKILSLLDQFPAPSFKKPLIGLFDKCLFLPKRHPRVVCWHVDFAELAEEVENYQKQLIAWLEVTGFPVSSHRQEWMPHVTLARQPFNAEAWMAHFIPLPVSFEAIHLYESLGYSEYKSLWITKFVPE